MFSRLSLTLFSLGLLNLAAGGEVPPREKLAAKANGEPIYVKNIEDGLPADALASTLKSIKAEKLERLICTTLMRQFIKTQNIQVDEAAVEADLADFRKNLPALACGCCLYPSLDAFLATTYRTLAELRQELWNRRGLNSYIDAQWKAAYPNEAALAAFAKQRGVEIRQNYIKTWQILFSLSNVNQAFAIRSDEELGKEIQAKAQEAWQRLEKGEDFGKLAKELSQDQSSAPKGGYIGFVSREESPFGEKATAALAALKPGAYSQPLASPWGWHIFKRETLTDADVLEKLKEMFALEKEDEVFKTIEKFSKVECFPPYERVSPAR